MTNAGIHPSSGRGRSRRQLSPGVTLRASSPASGKGGCAPDVSTPHSHMVSTSTESGSPTGSVPVALLKGTESGTCKDEGGGGSSCTVGLFSPSSPLALSPGFPWHCRGESVLQQGLGCSGHGGAQRAAHPSREPGTELSTSLPQHPCRMKGRGESRRQSHDAPASQLFLLLPPSSASSHQRLCWGQCPLFHAWHLPPLLLP